METFDKVLVRDTKKDVWRAAFLSYYTNNGYYGTVGGGCYKYCIPYNENTKKLHMTNKDTAPEFKWGEIVEVRDSPRDAVAEAIFIDFDYTDNVRPYCVIVIGETKITRWKHCNKKVVKDHTEEFSL